MKILMANKFHYNRGGAETYVFNLSDLLEKEGHEVIPFSMDDNQNMSSPYSEYFVKNIDYVDSLDKFSITTGARVALRSVYSREAKRNIERLIKDTKPDIAHLNNIHYHLTPSIIRALKKHNVPIIWTLHDYTLICPNTHFLNNGEVCERCKRYKYFNAPLTKCKKGSFSASFLACVDSYIHRLMSTYAFVDKFISPSKFLKDKMVEYGVDEKRITHIPNFINTEKIKEIKKEGTVEDNHSFVFFGRLSAEKGVDTLVQAVSKLKGAQLLIAGEGPAEKDLQNLSHSLNGSRIDFLGHLKTEEVSALLNKASFVVMPSRWYENFPYSILEAFSFGKPVIGARIGGIPEQIDDGVDGLLFEPGNKDDLRNKINRLIDNPSLVTEMGKKAKQKIFKKYDPKTHYDELIKIYRQVS
ncbi:hypothetical protein LCGC14_1563750 [marine sediment metagenome]|uniref:Glycosyltransferase subfamily 4-like N-terminal domain-containing protein n=1 Tax=marine sediment metagenome TaxID=412755 RepID=A0A0F9J7X0_9ZZZZ